MRAVDTIVWPGDNVTYAYTDITGHAASIGVFSSPDGLAAWKYHGLAVHRNTSVSDATEVGTPAALVKAGRVYVYFKYTAANGTRGIGIASAATPLGPFDRLPPAAPAPEGFQRPFGSGGIFDDPQVFEHHGKLHMFHSRKWSNDTPGCISNGEIGRNDCIEWMVSDDAVRWTRRGIVLAARDASVGPRNCTKEDRGLSCIEGGLEPLSARIYGDSVVLLTDGRAIEAFVAPVSGLASTTAAGLRFEKATEPFLAPYTYARLPSDYVATALRVMPRNGHPRYCGLSQSGAGGLSFVVYPVK